jgi:hypothetical protein
MSDDTLFERTILDKVIELQEGLIAEVTGGVFKGGDDRYRQLRREMANRGDVKGKLPDFVNRYQDLSQIWQFMKHKLAHYDERRVYIWDSFAPLIASLEAHDQSPGAPAITGRLDMLDAEAVQAAWQKALDRRLADPEGAITAARTLLEAVCKHLLDDMSQPYDDKADLPKLYGLTAANLNLAPDQHTEKSFKAILGSCQSVVEHLGSLRNKISDAHGRGRRPIKPKPRHAELAVNLAGAVAAFLVATWSDRS